MDIVEELRTNAHYNTYNIDVNLDLINQIYELKEDLIQYQTKKNDISFTIDIGWYPEFDVNGTLKLFVIENFDWSNPLIKVQIDYRNFESELQSALCELDIF